MTRTAFSAYVRAYVRDRDVPGTVGPGLTWLERLAGMVVLITAGVTVTILSLVPIALAAWFLVGELAAYATVLLGLPVSYLSGMYVGGPFADYLLQRPIEGVSA